MAKAATIGLLLVVPVLAMGQDNPGSHPHLDLAPQEAGGVPPAGSSRVSESEVNGTEVLERLEASRELLVPVGSREMLLRFSEKNYSRSIGDGVRLLKVVPSVLDRGRVAYVDGTPSSLAGDIEFAGKKLSFQLQALDEPHNGKTHEWQVFGASDFPEELEPRRQSTAVPVVSATSLESSAIRAVDEALAAADFLYPSQPHDAIDAVEPSPLHGSVGVGSISGNFGLNAYIMAAAPVDSAYTHNFYTVRNLMVDDMNERAFEEETLAGIAQFYGYWTDLRHCGTEAECYLDAVANAFGMPTGDELDGYAF